MRVRSLPGAGSAPGRCASRRSVAQMISRRGELVADAEVLADAEPDVARHAIGAAAGAALLAEPQIRALEVEAARVGEDRLVVVGRHQGQAHDLAGTQVHAVQLDVGRQLAILVHDDAVTPHELGERGLQQRRVPFDRRADVGLAHQHREEVDQGAIGGLAARDEQQRDEGWDLGLGQRLAGRGAAARDARHEIASRALDALGDEPGDAVGEASVGGDPLAARRLDAGERGDHRGCGIGEESLVRALEAEQPRDDPQGQRARQRRHHVERALARVRARAGRRRRSRRAARSRAATARRPARGRRWPAATSCSGPSISTIVGPDHVREDALVGQRRVRLRVGEHGDDIVVARQQPAIVDGVVEQRLRVAQALPGRERVA